MHFLQILPPHVSHEKQNTLTLHYPLSKLTWQWKMDMLKMYSLLNMWIFYCHVSLLEGIYTGYFIGMVLNGLLSMTIPT